MARFDIYANPDADERELVPYMLDVQNEFLRDMETRVVIPLWTAGAFGKRLRDLNPELNVEKRAVVMDTSSIGAIPVADLRRPIGNLGAHQLEITNALDTLFGGF